VKNIKNHREKAAMKNQLTSAETAQLLRESGDELNALIIRAQELLAAYIVPDSGITDREVIGELLGLLDGPEQRRAQKRWAAAIASLR